MKNLLLILLLINGMLFAQVPSVKNLYQLSDAKTRSISPENFSGEKEKVAWQRSKKDQQQKQHES